MRRRSEISATRTTDRGASFLPFGRPAFGDEEIAAVSEVLRSGWVGMGEQTLAFERELASYVGAGQVVSLSSCTAALFLSLLTAGVGEGDEVICPSLTWCSTANAALYTGARAVFCDIDPLTMQATPEMILARVTPRTRAVVIVHFGGLAADVEALRDALPPHIAIIEDAAHALGARYPNGRPVGSSGNLVCFSFYANKNLSTAEGGAIALSDPARADRLGSLRQHGMPSNAWTRYTQRAAPTESLSLQELGFKFNYTDLQAAIGRVQLRRQAELDARRLAIARYYAERLTESDLIPQSHLTASGHARHLFVVRLPACEHGAPRNALVERVRAGGIGLSVHYPPLHRMPLYAHTGALPNTDAIAGGLITLPISASMTEADAERAWRVIEEERAVTPKRINVIVTKKERTNAPRVKRPGYGFGGKLTEAFPSQILMDVSEICNLSCVHCPHPEFKVSEHYGRRLLDPELNDKLVEEVREHGVGQTQYIRYASNGEPFTHPHLVRMLDVAARRSGVPVTLTTNGTLLTPARVEAIIDSGISLVDISIDAITPETYAAVRVGGKLRNVERNVQSLIDLARQKGARTKVVVSFVEQPANQHEAARFDAVWRERGADQVVIRRLHSCSGAKEALAAERRVTVAAESRRPCLYPWERIGLNAAGQLFFCPSDWVHGSVIGDFRNMTIFDAWHGEFYQSLRRAHLENEYSSHPFCGQCPDWEATRWPHQGRRYADMIQDFEATA
jgi:dTDP-4-amino-4,6-dideoxygalactose transaminase/MoaA/NifB/PqqE/SkfB family radical SAM enzyme